MALDVIAYDLLNESLDRILTISAFPNPGPGTWAF